MIQAIRAAFPGGSMTGAPKLRSMQVDGPPHMTAACCTHAVVLMHWPTDEEAVDGMSCVLPPSVIPG